MRYLTRFAGLTSCHMIQNILHRPTMRKGALLKYQRKHVSTRKLNQNKIRKLDTK